MFLFTTPPAGPEPTQKPAESSIARHLQRAAEATGISFDYLMRTAKRESGLNPVAKAPTSSATGLFQFIEQTWLGLIKKSGPQHGLQAEAEAIQQDRSGRYSVSDAAMRRQILDLRKDPALASTLAGVLTQKNRTVLKDQIGRDPNAGELYMAHFLGAQGASDLIGLAQSAPEQSAAKAFPDAASANRSIFFDSKGRARSVREVYARLASFHGADAAPATQIAQALQAAPAPVEARGRVVPAGSGSIPRLATATGQLRSNNALHGLFRGGGDAPAAETLRKTWIKVGNERMRVDAPSFFPRAEPVVEVASARFEAKAQSLSDAPPPEAARLANPAAPNAKPVVAAVNGAPLDLMMLARSQARKR
jgi:hypothetical protein